MFASDCEHDTSRLHREKMAALEDLRLANARIRELGEEIKTLRVVNGLRTRIKELEELARAYMDRTWDVLNPENLSEPDPARAREAWEKADEELRRVLARG
jgi:hypothetical protein